MRTFQTQRLGRVVQVENKEFLHFSGTAYLGIGNQPAFEQKLIEGIKRHGAGHGSSRDSTVQLEIYEAFEKSFAKAADAPSALCVSSGYLAGRLALEYLEGKYDQVWVAPGAHPAILPKKPSPTSKSRFDQWADACIGRSRSLMGQRILIVSNAVNPIHPEIHNFEWVDRLHSQNRYGLLIDDSHAFGTLSSGLYGTFHTWRHLNADLIVCGSLAKAFGLPGGILIGDEKDRLGVRQLPMFRGASPPAPAFLHAFLESLETYQTQWEKLMANTKQVCELAASIPGLSALQDFPVLSFAQNSWVEALEKEGIIVSSFPYPSPNDPTVNRIVISAEHTLDDLLQLVNVLKALSEK